MNENLVIFDLDGTLLDTIEDLSLAANYTLKKMGYKCHSVAKLQGMVGGGISKLLERAMPESMRCPENIQRARSIFMPYYYDNIYVHTKPYGGVYEMLHSLKEKGCKMAVASNKFQKGVDKLIQHFFPSFEFVDVLGSESGFALKPNPKMVAYLTKKAGVALENVCMVGDSWVDYNTAISAGVNSLLVSWGFVGREGLQQCASAIVVDSPLEIVQNYDSF